MTEFKESKIRRNIKPCNPEAKKPPPPKPIKELVVRCDCGKILKMKEFIYE